MLPKPEGHHNHPKITEPTACLDAGEIMMPNASVADLLQQLEGQLESWREGLRINLDFAALEAAVTTSLDEVSAAVLANLLAPLLSDEEFLGALKGLGGQLGMRLKDFREVSVRLSNGQAIRVKTAYFVKALPKRGRRRRGPNGRGAYLGLEVLGLVSGCSRRLVSAVVEAALLCPSLAVAQQVLARRAIELDVKTIRRLCRELGEAGLAHRGAGSFDGEEALSGGTLVIGIDGGRLRERRRKRGRKPAQLKRQGYHTDWREPKLFTLYLLDAQGAPSKRFAPVHDATLGDHAALFAVLEQYLRALELDTVQRLVFCGDGAPWIWSGVEALCKRLGLARTRVTQVLDYTPAKQNLQELIDLVPAQVRAQQPDLAATWKGWLWQDQLDQLRQAICQAITGKHRRQRALSKWQRYFAHHQQRMQYQSFQQAKLPCGSGSVESAIRRVINLRLKAPGSFWTQPMAECFLFLRAQLLSGRWEILLNNLTRKTTQLLIHQWPIAAAPTSNPMLKAA